MAKTFIIVTYLTATLLGAFMGCALTAIGRKYIDRTSIGARSDVC